MRAMSTRVLHIQDHTIPELSGYAVRSRYIVACQRALGLDARVVSSARHPACNSREETLDGIPFFRTARPQSLVARAMSPLPILREWPLTRALEERIVEVASAFSPQVLHAHSPIFNGWATRRAARRLGLPWVYEIRAFWEDDAVDKKKIREWGFTYRQVRAAETRICRDASAVVTICRGLREDIISRGIPATKVHLIANGVDSERFVVRERDEQLAQRCGVQGERVIGFVGSFFRYEGLPLLVHAFADLVRDNPRVKLLLLGGGEDEAAVRTAVASLGIEASVILPGRVPHAEVDAWYSLIDLLVYPRLSVRLTELVTPLKPLEAAAAGKCMLGSDVGGVKELLERVGCKRLFRAGSRPDLVQAMQEWLRTSEEALRAEQSRQVDLAAAECQWIQAVRPILSVYGSLLAPRELVAAGARGAG